MRRSEHFRRAVELEPNYAPARTNLGLLLLDCGQAEEALKHCQEATRLQPDTAALHHNLGNVLRNLERFVEARSAYLEALRLEPNLTLSRAHLGLVLHQQGELDNALPWLKMAAEAEPSNPRFWQYLAELYDEMEESAESLPCWDRVIALAPDRADAHVALGWAMQEEGRISEAGEHYRTAVQYRRSRQRRRGRFRRLGRTGRNGRQRWPIRLRWRRRRRGRRGQGRNERQQRLCTRLGLLLDARR